MTGALRVATLASYSHIWHGSASSSVLPFAAGPSCVLFIRRCGIFTGGNLVRIDLGGDVRKEVDKEKGIYNDEGQEEGDAYVQQGFVYADHFGPTE